MRIAICDDEEAQLNLLKKYLLEWGREHKTAINTQLFPNGESFLFSWEEDRRYDLLILDIEMGKMSGIEVAKKIRRQDEDMPILFATGYDDYMAQGYEVSALHYLLKPVNKEKFYAVLDKLLRKKEQNAKEEKLFFQTKEGNLSLPLSKIWYIEACSHQCILHTETQEYVLKQSISEAATFLAERKEIMQCHRSYLVNLKHIAAIVKNEIILDNQIRLPVSRNLIKEVNAAFIAIYSGKEL